jgi:hypothetical protein
MRLFSLLLAAALALTATEVVSRDLSELTPRQRCNRLSRQIEHFEGRILELARERGDSLWQASTEKHIARLKDRRADRCPEEAEQSRILAEARARSERFMDFMRKATRGAARYFSGGLF